MSNGWIQAQNALRSRYFRDWVLASVAGYLLWHAFETLSFFVAPILLQENAHLWDAYDVTCLVIGSGLFGLCQWLVLRQQFRRAYWWIVATTLGFFFAEIVINNILMSAFMVFSAPFLWTIAPLFESPLMFDLCVYLCSGLLVGSAQWLFFRKRVKNAVTWIWMLLIAELLIFMVALVPVPVAYWDESITSSYFLSIVFEFARAVTIGVIGGSVTGLPLMRFVAQVQR